MKDWSWQKWVGKLTPVVVAVLTVGVWEFAEIPAPGWAAIVAGLVTMIAQAAVALFPPKV